MIILQRPLDACCVKMLMKVTIASTTHGATATAGTTMKKINANRLVRFKFVFDWVTPFNIIGCLARSVLRSLYIFICVIASSEYAQSVFGSDCNELGNVRLVSKQQCRAAAISLGKSFIRQKDDANYPTGCHFSHSRNTYWNIDKKRD